MAQVFNAYVSLPYNTDDLISDACCFVDGNLAFDNLALVKELKSRWDSLFKTAEYSASVTATFYKGELSFFS